MKHYGLIGRPLGHSWSQAYFREKFSKEGIADADYTPFEAPADVQDADSLRCWLKGTSGEGGLVRAHHLLGFNVTLPFKQTLMPLLDEVEEVAQRIGAVNTVCVYWQDEVHFTLRGFNTDAPAFADTLRPRLQPWHTEALVLGTGGAARAVAYALAELGIRPTFVSRTPSRPQPWPTVDYSKAVELARSVFLLVNATPVGMHPDEASTPWPDVHTLSPRHLCYDVVYNPEETRFLLQAELCGADTLGGRAMLHRQAELSWQRWRSAGLAGEGR